jgi:hypothetical protein
MPAKKKSGIGSTNPVPFGMSNRVMKRKKPINLDYIKKIEPLTDNQEIFFEKYKQDQNLVAYGCAGTGKTFITLYNALLDVLDPKTPYEKIYIVRSLVATREIGFLPGDHEDKSSLYQIPYKNMVKYMFEMPDDSAKVQFLFGLPLLFVVRLLTIVLSLSMSFKISTSTNSIPLSLVLVKVLKSCSVVMPLNQTL